jgi:CRISPR/Cas system-associated endonuclease Cas1
MDNRLKISEETLNQIIEQESRKTVGIILKRYEFIEDKEVLKKEIKEILYEAFRNLRDMIRINGKESITLTNTKSKE